MKSQATPRTDLSNDLEARIAKLRPLSDAVRRRIYLYVVRERKEVSRLQVARALGVSRELARFHLDRLEADGLLQSRNQARVDRRGPGAGRPAKVYRASGPVNLTVPPRRYELLARILLRALREDGGPESFSHLGRIARDHGLDLASGPLSAAWEPGAKLIERGDAKEKNNLLALLSSCGFEPYEGSDGEIELRNCPFHELRLEAPETVCGLNLSLMSGIAERLRLATLRPVLDPRPNQCCVVFRRG